MPHASSQGRNQCQYKTNYNELLQSMSHEPCALDCLMRLTEISIMKRIEREWIKVPTQYWRCAQRAPTLQSRRHPL
jgi:hypothetical protein